MSTTHHGWLSKGIAALIALLQLLAMIPSASAAPAGESRAMMVSAYYSPLPAQRFYMRGSYEADKKLNGRGTNGADGTPVYVGMIAAPRTYPFGTHVRIPGLGVGVVHDRGGAIDSGRRYDRIDVWMGSGEEGLARALNWGMRLVEGEVFFGKDHVQPGLDFTWVSSELPQSTLNRLMARTLLNPVTFSKPITKASPKADIDDLQEALRMFGYFHGAVTGVFDSETREALKIFQVAEGVLPNPNIPGSGNFGPKTQKALKSKIENFNDTVLKEQGRLRGNLADLAAGLGKKDEGSRVYSMQQILWELGYFKGELNGKYDADTMDAVFAFQKENGILSNEWEKGAGYYGQKTHTALVAAVDRRIEKLVKMPAEMQVWVPAKVDLPKLSALSASGLGTHREPLAFGLKIEPKTLPAFRFSTDLSLGSKGEEVQKLQTFLIGQGFLAQGLNTGTFGEKTEKALIQFQLNKKIVQSTDQSGVGKVGPKTRALLNSML